MAASGLEAIAVEFATRKNIIADTKNPLGSGTDGGVWRTNRSSAIKAFEREENYRTERDCYQRLLVQRVFQLAEFRVPKLIDIDDELFVVEMEIVAPTYVLDFGKCYLDRRPDFSAEVMADWEAE